LLVPGVAAVAGLAFLAWKPGLARSMLGSPRALGFADVAALAGIDHAATGRVVLLQTGHGRHVVRLEALEVEPGPDYHVYLAPGPDRRSPEGATHLGRLRGNRGSQNYPVPSVVAADVPVTVLIWCRAFAVPVAAATIR